jgi:DNA repair protein RecO (recombination protein O)
MPTYSDYGIVLSSSVYSETDKIFGIYTRENGLVRAIGKGARKTTSRFGGKLDQLSCCHFHFGKGKNLDVISECEQVNSFSLLKKDLHRLTSGILFLEIVNNFAHEQESESNFIYELLYEGLDKLQHIENVDLFVIEFILNFLSIHGFRPQFNNCVSCSREISEQENIKIYPYSSVLGGLLCGECSQSIDYKKISIEVLDILHSKQSTTFLKNSNYLKQAQELLMEHLNVRGKSKIKAFEIVTSL